MVERSLPGGETTSGPSEKAVEALAVWWWHNDGRLSRSRWDYITEPVREHYRAQAQAWLAVAHDPKLGEERSVRLGDVLDALRNRRSGTFAYPGTHEAADFLAREFGGGFC